MIDGYVCRNAFSFHIAVPVCSCWIALYCHYEPDNRNTNVDDNGAVNNISGLPRDGDDS